MLPVMTWSHFFQKTRSLINPLVTEAQLRVMAMSLHDMGEVRERALGVGGCKVRREVMVETKHPARESKKKVRGRVIP